MREQSGDLGKEQIDLIGDNSLTKGAFTLASIASLSTADLWKGLGAVFAAAVAAGGEGGVDEPLETDLTNQGFLHILQTDTSGEERGGLNARRGFFAIVNEIVPPQRITLGKNTTSLWFY